MPKISEKPLTRLCLRLWTEDVEEIRELCEKTGQEFNHVVRECIRNFARHMRANLRHHIDQRVGD